MDKLIKRDWRNWKQPQTPSGSTGSALGESQELGADVQKCSKEVKLPKFDLSKLSDLDKAGAESLTGPLR